MSLQAISGIALLMTLCGGISYLCTRLMCVWLLRKPRVMVQDIPNERSSHVHPVPKGGGIAIIVGMVFGVLPWMMYGVLKHPQMLSTALGLVVLLSGVAALGYVSDRHDISPAIRLVVQVLVCGITAGVLGVPLPWMLVSALVMAAVVNFYNFMDGIDGIAGVQGIVSGATIAAAGTVIGMPAAIVVGIVLASACAAFLSFNVTPAKMFMGDVGSYSIGFVLVAVAVSDARLAVPVVFSLGVFLFDTTLTLVRRIWRGECWYKAHRSHFYQRAVRTGLSHMQVTVGVGIAGVVLGSMGVVFGMVSPKVQVVLIACAVVLLITGVVVVMRREHAMAVSHQISGSGEEIS